MAIVALAGNKNLSAYSAERSWRKAGSGA